MVLCTAVTVFLLFMILGYVVYNGASAIDWNFLTGLPLPPGESGGGIANALVGSVLVVACAVADRDAHRLGAAIFVNEFPSARLGRTVRFMAEVLTGVPSIVVGLFAYALVVRPMGSFSGFSGSIAYAFIMVPIILITSHEAFRLVPTSLREASLALGRAEMADDPRRRVARVADGVTHRRRLGFFPSAGRSGADAVHRVRQSVLEFESRQAHRDRTDADLHLRDRSL